MSAEASASNGDKLSLPLEAPDELPTDWKVEPARKHLLISDYGLSLKGQPKGRYPILRMNCQIEGRVVFDNLQFVDLDEKTFAQFRLAPGDVLFNRTNSIEHVGRTALFDSKREAVFASYLVRLRFDTREVCPRYINYYLNAPETQAEVKTLASRAVGQANISASKLAGFDLVLPPKPEQEKIAAVLLGVQRAVELEGKLVRTSRELKTATMRHLFTHGLRREPSKETELGPLPESWDLIPLGTHALLAQYGLSVKGAASGRVPILRMNCQVDGQVSFRSLQFANLDDATLDAFRLEDGDLLFNRTNSIEHVGRTAVFHDTREAVFASYLIRLRLNANSLDPDFANYYLNMESTQRELKRLASRAVGQANISASKLKTFEVPVPRDPEEQKEIARQLAVVDAKIRLHERKRDTLRALFRTLLRDLLTARRRVHELPIDVAEVTTA